VSGGKDGKLLIFNGSDLTLEKSIDFEGSFPKAIDYMGGKILVGMRNGSIFEIDEASQEKRHILASHHEGEAWGLEVLDQDGQFLTCGDDNKVMLFDYVNKKFIDQGTVAKTPSKDQERNKKSTASTLSNYPPNQQARAVCYNPYNGHVAVSNNFGKVTIRSKENLNRKIKTLKDCTEWSEMMKYSPDGQKLAVSSHDNNIYVYEVNNDYALYCKFAKHNSYVTSIDWSQDCKYIRSVCGAYEKLYFNVETKEFDSAGLTNTKDTVWQTHSAKFGWNVEGIYPSGEDGTHINHVDFSSDGKLIATADDFGLVNIYRNPCCNLKHKAKSYCGHSEHVVRVIFSKDCQKLFSIGGYDKSVIQWRRK